MADTTFTIIGTTGAGKTCYLLGMYCKMCAGMKGYTLTTNDYDDVNLKRLYKILKDETLGQARFPAGTDSLSEYEFTLEREFKPIMSFKWMDYPGNMLTDKNDITDYDKVKQSIRDSSSLFICIDGALLVGEDTDEKIERLQDNCAVHINSFFSDYLKENGKLPPTAFIITKYDLCHNDTDDEELAEIMEEAFSAFFIDDEKSENIVTIIPVSLGANITSSDFTGKCRPLNIHLPIFMGIYFGLLSQVNKFIEEKKEIKNNMQIKQNYLDEEKDKWFFFRDHAFVATLQQGMIKAENKLKEKDKLLDKKNKYVQKLLEELDKINLVYLDGERRENFSAIFK